MRLFYVHRPQAIVSARDEAHARVLLAEHAILPKRPRRPVILTEIELDRPSVLMLRQEKMRVL